MMGPNDLVGILWAMTALGAISLAVSAHSCFRRPSLNRVVLMASCFFVVVAHTFAVQTVKGYPFMAVRTAFLFSVTSYNVGLWTARLYVCIRMSKLTPSPSLSSAFNNIAVVSGAYGALLVAAYTSDAGDWYRTNPPNKPAVSSLSVSVSGLFANLTFDAVNAFLHFKSLRMFATSSAVRRKLCIMTASTSVSTAFSLARSIYQIQNRTIPRLAMGAFEITLLPASIVLGEFVVTRIGRPVASASNSSNCRASANKPVVGSGKGEAEERRYSKSLKEKSSVRQQA